MKTHEVEVTYRERFGNHVLLRYRWDEEPPTPGQFIMVRASVATLDPFLLRPFFAHDHVGGELSLLFEIRGRGTRLLAENGAELLVSAPLGQGFVLDGEGPVALVGGGVWIAPLKLLSRRLDDWGVQHDVFLEIPETAPEDYGELVRANYPNATLVSTDGSSASPQVLLSHAGDLARYRVVYASGSAEVLADVKRACEGLVPAQVALRERMACANGSCFGCAVPVWQGGGWTYARACVEGPVFSADALRPISGD